MEVLCDEVCLSEKDFRAGCEDDGTYGGGYIVTADDVRAPVEIECHKGGVARGFVVA